MKTKSYRNDRSRKGGLSHKGYTLIEILVTVAIIAGLAAVSFPVTIRFMESGREAKALTEIRNLDTAIYSFQQDNHGMFPGEFDTDFTVDQTFRTNSGKSGNKSFKSFFRSLIGTETDESTNMKGKVYFDAKPAVKGLDGFTRGSGGAINALLDPWGSSYRIFLDFSGDGEIDTNLIYMHPNNPFAGDVIPATSGATSLGREGKWSKYSLSSWSGSATNRE